MSLVSYLPTMLILLALGGVVFLAVRSIRRSRKKGGSCGCGCAACPMSAACHPAEDAKETE